MKSRILPLLTMLTLLPLGTLNAEEMATLLSIKGNVTVMAPGSDKLVAGQINQTLSSGTKIKTDKNSSASIKLDDGSVLDLGAESEIMISPNTNKQSGKRSILLFLGTLWNKITKSFSGKVSYVVNTPNAVAGVRGTEFVVHVADDGSVKVKVKSGIVGVGEDSYNGADVKAGQQIESSDDGLGKVDKADSLSDKKWRTKQQKNLQKNTGKLSNGLTKRINTNYEKLKKVKKQLDEAFDRMKVLKEQESAGDATATVKIKALNREIDDLLDLKAAYSDMAQTQLTLHKHYEELAADPTFNTTDPEILKANSESLILIKRELDALIAEGMDQSMESMEKMINDYANGARNTLRDKDGSAAEAVFKSNPDMEF